MAITASDLVKQFAPNADPAYIEAFADRGGLLAAAQIDTPRRLTHFMAQAMHETGALTILVESGRYTTRNLARMWDSGNWHRYFTDRDACLAMADQCAIDNGVALFNTVYGPRMGNRGVASGDGWRYRGRGLLQTTGRGAYRDFGQRCGVDFEENPNLIVAPAHALKPALMEWTDSHLNVAADHDDIAVITKRINGGLVGLDSRKAWFAKLWAVVDGTTPLTQSDAWRVQVALAARGYDVGQPDGVVGARTRAAIIAFRIVTGLAPSNAIAPDLTQALGL